MVFLISGIDKLFYPFQQGLVLLVELVVQHFMLLQNKWHQEKYELGSNDAWIKVPLMLGG